MLPAPVWQLSRNQDPEGPGVAFLDGVAELVHDDIVLHAGRQLHRRLERLRIDPSFHSRSDEQAEELLAATARAYGPMMSGHFDKNSTHRGRSTWTGRSALGKRSMCSGLDGQSKDGDAAARRELQQGGERL